MPAVTRRSTALGYALLAPSLFGVAAFLLLPILVVVWLSLYRWDLLGPLRYVGLANWRSVLTDPGFGNSLIVTAVFVAIVVPAPTVLGLGADLPLGGAWVLTYALRYHPAISGVIATSPAVRTATKPPAAQLALARLMCRIAPTFTMPNGLDRNALSRDPAVIRAYIEDPLVHDRLSARLGLDLLHAGSWSLDHAAEFPLDLLLVQGSADRIVSAPATAEFAERAGQRCTFKLWDGLYHETHNEPEKAEVLAFNASWIARHL